MIVDCLDANGNPTSIEYNSPTRSSLRGGEASFAPKSRASAAGERQAALPSQKHHNRGKRAHCHIDLGLALLSTKEYALGFGVCRTNEEIAAWCGCRPQRIDQIYQQALRKLRMKVRFYNDPVLKDLVDGLITR